MIINKIRNRILLSILLLAILIFFMMIEKPVYKNVIDSFLGNIEFNSVFDKIKFFLPIILLLSLISDHLSFLLEAKGSIIITRFKNRKIFLTYILKRLYFIVFLFWSSIIFLTIAISYCLNIKKNFNFNLVVLFTTGYLLYSMIVTIQILLSLFYGTNISFIVVTMLSIISTLVSNSIIKYLFIIPIGMDLYQNSFLITIFKILLMLILILVFCAIIYNKIERLDIG